VTPSRPGSRPDEGGDLKGIEARRSAPGSRGARLPAFDYTKRPRPTSSRIPLAERIASIRRPAKAEDRQRARVNARSAAPSPPSTALPTPPRAGR